MWIGCTNKLIYCTNKCLDRYTNKLIDSSAWNSHTTTDINGGQEGYRRGQKGAREGKKGTREGKKGAAPFYFGLAGTLIDVFIFSAVMQQPTPHAITTITVSTSGQDGKMFVLVSYLVSNTNKSLSPCYAELSFLWINFNLIYSLNMLNAYWIKNERKVSFTHNKKSNDRIDLMS